MSIYAWWYSKPTEWRRYVIGGFYTMSILILWAS